MVNVRSLIGQFEKISTNFKRSNSNVSLISANPINLQEIAETQNINAISDQIKKLTSTIKSKTDFSENDFIKTLVELTTLLIELVNINDENIYIKEQKQICFKETQKCKDFIASHPMIHKLDDLNEQNQGSNLEGIARNLSELNEDNYDDDDIPEDWYDDNATSPKSDSNENCFWSVKDKIKTYQGEMCAPNLSTDAMPPILEDSEEELQKKCSELISEDQNMDKETCPAKPLTDKIKQIEDATSEEELCDLPAHVESNVNNVLDENVHEKSDEEDNNEFQSLPASLVEEGNGTKPSETLPIAIIQENSSKDEQYPLSPPSSPANLQNLLTTNSSNALKSVELIKNIYSNSENQNTPVSISRSSSSEEASSEDTVINTNETDMAYFKEACKILDEILVFSNIDNYRFKLQTLEDNERLLDGINTNLEKVQAIITSNNGVLENNKLKAEKELLHLKEEVLKNVEFLEMCKKVDFLDDVEDSKSVEFLEEMLEKFENFDADEIFTEKRLDAIKRVKEALEDIVGNNFDNVYDVSSDEEESSSHLYNAIAEIDEIWERIALITKLSESVQDIVDKEEVDGKIIDLLKDMDQAETFGDSALKTKRDQGILELYRIQRKLKNKINQN